MRSLRARLNIAFVMPTAAIVVVLVVVAYLAGRQGLENELDRRLEEVGQVVATELSEWEAGPISRLDESSHRTRERIEDRLGTVEQNTEVRRIAIFDDQQASLVDTDGDTQFGDTIYWARTDRGEVRTTYDDQQVTSGPLYRTEDGMHHKRAYAPIVDEDAGEHGETVAVVGVKASADYFELLTRFATVLTLLGAFGVVVVVGIGVWFSRRLVQPVDTLVEGAEQLAKGELETSVVAEARRGGRPPEEFDFLMRSFEEMREAIVERDQQMQMMLGGIAHEVRNPLGGMELFCGLLKEDLRELSANGGEHNIEMVERIEREIDYLERVVEGFLDFARPDDPQLEYTDAEDFIDEIAELVESDLQQHDCRLDVQVDPGLELTVDRGQLRRALINVIRNACQASDEPDSPIRLCCRAVDGLREIEVTDQGCGIPEEQLDELTRPFYTTREKGSGLGLALTRRIAEGHGGSLQIDSSPGEGTTVRVVLPFDEEVARDGADDEKEGNDDYEVPDGWLG